MSATPEALSPAARAALFDQLKQFDHEEAHIKEAMRPFAIQIREVRTARFEALESAGVDLFGECESCGTYLLLGDACCSVEEGYLCASCSPTLADALASWEADDEDDADLRAAVISSIQDRIAVEGPEAKCATGVGQIPSALPGAFRGVEGG